MIMDRGAEDTSVRAEDRPPLRGILIITFHGAISQTNQTNRGNMNIRKINAVPPGVCNILSDADANRIVDTILTYKKKPYDGTLDAGASEILRFLKEGTKGDRLYQLATKSANLKRFSEKSGFILDDLRNYFETLEHHYQIYNIDSGMEYMDKTYTLIKSEKRAPHNKRNNSLMFTTQDGVNETPYIDLTDELLTQLMKTRNDEDLTLKYSKIIRYIEDTYNLDELITLDLSCMIDEANPDDEGRDNTHFRRSLLNTNIAHGKSKRRKKKSRRTKKKKRKARR